MNAQDYVLKKHVRAKSAAEALSLDADTPVHEVYLVADKPDKLPEAVGYKTIATEES